MADCTSGSKREGVDEGLADTEGMEAGWEPVWPSLF